MNVEPDEYELALRARDGDPEALAALVARTRLGLFTLAYAELRNYEDAQDAVASALLQICLHVKELREPSSVRAWMKQIVRNEVRRLRRNGSQTQSALEDADAQGVTPGPYWLRLDIERALCRLPIEQAGVIQLFYLAGLSIDEIARRLERSEGTVKSWLHRGRQRLATEMEVYGPPLRCRRGTVGEQEEPGPSGEAGAPVQETLDDVAPVHPARAACRVRRSGRGRTSGGERSRRWRSAAGAAPRPRQRRCSHPHRTTGHPSRPRPSCRRAGADPRRRGSRGGGGAAALARRQADRRPRRRGGTASLPHLHRHRAPLARHDPRGRGSGSAGACQAGGRSRAGACGEIEALQAGGW
jgi:RNA polymerase sigma factor (sigma-70 family)